MPARRIAFALGTPLLAAALCALPGCGPSAADEKRFLDFYAAVDEVWVRMSSPGGPDAQAKLDRALAGAERAAAEYKLISPKVRARLYKRHRAVHEASREKCKGAISAPGAGVDFLTAMQKMDRLLLDAFGLGNKIQLPPAPPPGAIVVNTHLLYAYENAYEE